MCIVFCTLMKTMYAVECKARPSCIQCTYHCMWSIWSSGSCFWCVSRNDGWNTAYRSWSHHCWCIDKGMLKCWSGVHTDSSHIFSVFLYFCNDYLSIMCCLQVDRAREVYKMIHEFNIRGTPEVYTIAVNCCSQTGDWEFACSVYSDMKRKGVAPDEVSSYSSSFSFLLLPPFWSIFLPLFIFWVLRLPWEWE